MSTSWSSPRPTRGARFEAGEQSTIEVVIDVVDPIAANYAGFLASGLSSAVNREILRRGPRGPGYAVALASARRERVSPELVAAPTRAELVNVAPSAPGPVAFFGPAVLALILQHLAITLIALSLVRERTSGFMDLFRVAPVSPAELMAGKVVAYGIIGGAIAAVTVALLVNAFQVPFLGSGVLGRHRGVLAAAWAWACLAVVSDSERQVVQLSLLLLLASVSSAASSCPSTSSRSLRGLAYLLPVTHGIRLLQDLMLRGSTTEIWEFWALGPRSPR